MSSWNSGYSTDVPYTMGYYRQQTPQHMAVACLLGGADCGMPRPDDPVSFLELGCGRGLVSLVLAACNPAWRVTAVDFSPLHVADARAMAAQAGVTNVTYLEADLATLADGPLAAAVPEADFCSMHGVWTWIAPAVRQGIVRLLAGRLRAGGALHVSYNALPNWQAALGMRRLIREAGGRLSRRSDRAAKAGAAVAAELAAAGARHLAGSPYVMRLLERMPEFDADYLAHEYMHTDAAPCFHADLCADLDAAKLEWVGTCNLLEAFPALTMTPEQQAVHDRAEDHVLRELIKDMCLQRSFRHDVFVRGARRIGDAARDAALGDVGLALTVKPDAFNYEADFASGRASLNKSFYVPLVERLARAPADAGALCVSDEGERRSNPGEVVAMLVGTGQAAILSAPDAPAPPAAARVDGMLARMLARPDSMPAPTVLASPRMGAGFPTCVGDVFVLDGLRDGLDPADGQAWVRRLGAPLDPEQEQKLRAMVMQLAEVAAPVWIALGALERGARPK